MKLVRTRYIYVDASQCDGDHYGDISFQLPTIMSANIEKRERLRIYLKKVILKYDWACLTSQNNTFSINGLMYALLLGSPNVYQIEDTMNKLNVGIEVTFNTADGRFYLKNVSASTLTFDLSDPTAAFKVLGFNNQTYSILAGATLVSIRPVDVSPSNVVFIHSNLSSKSYIIQKGQNPVQNNVLACIGMDVAAFDTKIWHDHNGSYSVILDGETVNKMVIQLKDQSGNFIVPTTPPLYVVCCEWYQDDEELLLEVMMESLFVQKLDLLASTKDVAPSTPQVFQLGGGPGQEVTKEHLPHPPGPNYSHNVLYPMPHPLNL